MADRHGPLHSALGRHVETANPGGIGEGGIVAGGTDIPDGGALNGAFGFVDDGELSLPSERLSVLAPAGARTDGDIDTASLLVAGALPDEGEITYTGSGQGLLYPSTRWYPTTRWIPDREWYPSTRWYPTTRWIPDEPSNLQVLVPNAKTTLSTMGVERPPDGAEPIEPGATVRTANTAAATPLAAREVDISVPRNVFDAGVAAPLAGATFGLGILSTPNASVAGQPANPLVGIKTASLLKRDAARRMLRRAGVTDVDSVEWLAGPQAASAGKGGEEPSMLGTTTEIEQFVGVISGDTGPWGVGVHVARITDDDHVIAAGVDRRPLANADGGFMDADHGTRLQRARELLVETVGRLQTR